MGRVTGGDMSEGGAAMLMWSEFHLFPAALAWADRAVRLGHRAALLPPGQGKRPRGAAGRTWVVEVVVEPLPAAVTLSHPPKATDIT